ncbi:hypothetical protein [Streptomyces natalensis]|uniref:hypothetical protein n=1 Tax=Streptomyces natalensis TaxID=68242 RepID=UPI000AA40801|nr:hypothetical protein [Streptomyces natalensis]
MRDPRKELPELPEANAAPEGKALDMAVQLVEALSADWDPSEHHDQYQERVRELLAGGTAPKAAPAPAAIDAQDLMSVLEASVEKARETRTERP